MTPGLNLTDYTYQELITVFAALGTYQAMSQVMTPQEAEIIDQFRAKLVEAGAIVRITENIASN